MESTSQDRFLDELLADLEGERVRPVADYEARYPELGEFVRTEVEALTRDHELAPEVSPAAGRFVRQRLLAEGGLAEVWLGRDSVLDRKVVLKQLRIDLLGNDTGQARLLREARVLSRIGHPGLARVLDVVDDQGRLTLVLPYVEGRTLAECLAEVEAGAAQALPVRSQTGSGSWTGQSHRGDPRPAVRLVEQIAGSMQVAHDLGVVHRDLKPQNVVIQPDGSPVVIDFGLAWELESHDARLTFAGDAVGTPLYMAPEQVEGGAVDGRTDLFALGAVLYELLTGRTPFAADTRKETFARILRGALVPPRRHNPAISRDLEAVCLKALERLPADRYATMQDFADELRRVLELRSPQAARRSAVTRVARRMVRSRMAWVVGVAAVVVAALGWGLWEMREDKVGLIAAKTLRDAVEEVSAGPGGFDFAVIRDRYRDDDRLGPVVKELAEDATREDVLEVAEDLFERNRSPSAPDRIELLLPRVVCPAPRPVFYVGCAKPQRDAFDLRLVSLDDGTVQALEPPVDAAELDSIGLQDTAQRRRVALPPGVVLDSGSRWRVEAVLSSESGPRELGTFEVVALPVERDAAFAAFAAWRQVHEGEPGAGVRALARQLAAGNPEAAWMLAVTLVPLGDRDWIEETLR